MATSVTLTADFLIAEESFKLNGLTVTSIVTTITPAGSDGYLATEKAIVDYVGGGLGKILVTAADTTLGYLYSKVTAGSGISTSVLNGGGNETLEIVNSSRTIITLEDCGLSAEPTSDVILYYNSTTTEWTSLAIGTNLSITGGVLNAAGSGGTAVEHRAAAVSAPVANTPVTVGFSSALGTVDADVIVTITCVDAGGNMVAYNLSSITVTGFQIETSTIATIYYQAFIKK